MVNLENNCYPFKYITNTVKAQTQTDHTIPPGQPSVNQVWCQMRLGKYVVYAYLGKASHKNPVSTGKYFCIAS